MASNFGISSQRAGSYRPFKSLGYASLNDTRNQARKNRLKQARSKQIRNNFYNRSLGFSQSITSIISQNAFNVAQHYSQIAQVREIAKTVQSLPNLKI